jgi:hypothetical protein
MSRKNPPKLELEYPVVRNIKIRMKNNPDISVDQIKGFDRRVRNSPVLLLIIQITNNHASRANRNWEKYKKAKSELDRINDTPYMKLQRENEDLKKQIRELQTLITSSSSS